MSLESKVDDAAGIFMGRCVSQQSQWDAAHKWIVTYSTFEVDQTLKGFPAQRVTVVTPGGSVDGVHQETIGVPKFREGEQHVIFLRDTKIGSTVLDFEQGDYRVTSDDRGTLLAEPAVSAAVLISDSGAPVQPETVRPLAEFQTSIRDRVRKREIEKMEMIRERANQEASLWNVVMRNRGLIALALAGAVLATWQLVKRS